MLQLMAGGGPASTVGSGGGSDAYSGMSAGTSLGASRGSARLGVLHAASARLATTNDFNTSKPYRMRETAARVFRATPLHPVRARGVRSSDDVLAASMPRAAADDPVARL